MRSALLVCFAAAAMAACAADTGNDDDDNESEDVGITDSELGESETSGFKMPSLALEDEKAIYAAKYTHVDKQRIIADNLLFDAVTYYDANKAKLKNKKQIAIVDFAKHSGKKRFYMIDMTTGAVTPHMVSHGSGSEGASGYATKFSDTNNSHMSSLGFVVTGSTCSSKHGRSLLLYGLQQSNAHMRPREIIIHGAAYVNESSSSRQGNSWGCFALDTSIKDKVISDLQGGSLLYANLGKPNTLATRPNAVAPSAPAEPSDPTEPNEPNEPDDP